MYEQYVPERDRSVDVPLGAVSGTRALVLPIKEM